MNLLPAILIGGPPHAGKSTLAYRLSIALRERGVAHYLLRAAPDGEGDWSYEAQPGLVQEIRFKSAWSKRWVDITCRDVARRTLPLLVDVGGNPTPEQEIIFDQCTHAILLTKEPSQHEQWLTLAHTHNLEVIADLQSELLGTNMLLYDSPGEPLAGMLAGLDRDHPLRGVVFDALAARVAGLLSFSRDEIDRKHLALPPFAHEQVQLVNLNEWISQLHPTAKSAHFSMADIKPILDAIRPDEPVALYGRAPIWLPVRIALERRLSWQFDVRLGWIQPLKLFVCAPDETTWQMNSAVEFTLTSNGSETCLSVRFPEAYIDYDEATHLNLPYIDPAQHVVIDGKIPLWLATSLTMAYRACASVNVRQVQQIG